MFMSAPIPCELPQDLLRNPPYSDAIPSWGANDAYLRANAEAEARTKELGHHVKFGIEVNIEIMSPSEANRLLNTQRSPVYHWRQSPRERFIRDLECARDLPLSFDPYANMYAALEKLAENYRQKPTPDSVEWLKNWRMARSFYHTGIRERVDVRTILARKNFVISSLHLLPPSMGGLRGCIENRHRPTHYGDGWWDGPNSIELRTPPTEGYEKAIAGYHHALWQLHHAIKHFGFVPLVHHAMAQAHFSVWRNSDNVNLMANRDDAALEQQKNIAEHLAHMVLVYPMQYPSSVRPVLQAENNVPIVGSSRASVIRVCDTNWELRLQHLSGMTHLARDLFLINSAVRCHVEPQPKSIKPAMRREVKIQVKKVMDKVELQVTGVPKDRFADAVGEVIQQSVGQGVFLDRQRMIDPFMLNTHPIRIVKKMDVESDRLRVACPFMSTLRAAIINDQGEIDVPSGVLRYNGMLMLNAIGKNSADLFSWCRTTTVPVTNSSSDEIVDEIHVYDGSVCNLETVTGWHELFKKLKVADNSFIDASALHPDLARHFDGLKVVGYRKEIHGGEWTAAHVNTRHHANPLMAGQLAAGKAQFLIWKATAAQREIFGFLEKRHYIFDPEEGTRFLIDVYRHLHKKNRKELGMQPSQFVVHHVIMKTLGDWLRRKRSDLPWQVPGRGTVRDYEILRFLISMHKNLINFIPEAMRYDPHAAKLLMPLRDNLMHPEKMYAPDMIWQTVLSICVMSPVTREIMMMKAEKSNTSETDIMYVRETMRKNGENLGSLAVRVAAGMQRTTTYRMKILEKYAALAGTIGKHNAKSIAPNKTPIGISQDSADTLIKDAVYGMDKGVLETATALLANPRPLAYMRKRALEGLRGGH